MHFRPKDGASKRCTDVGDGVSVDGVGVDGEGKR